MPTAQSIRPTGVTIKILAEDFTTKLRTELVRIKAGTVLPTHRHTNFEWVYVLDGELQDEFGRYKKGAFKINSKNSVHTSRSPLGCTLLVIRAGTYVPSTLPYAKKQKNHR